MAVAARAGGTGPDQVVALRSPHLNRLAKAVEVIAKTVGEAIKIEA